MIKIVFLNSSEAYSNKDEVKKLNDNDFGDFQDGTNHNNEEQNFTQDNSTFSIKHFIFKGSSL